MFLLENVPDLVYRHRDCFYDIMKTLMDLNSYELSWSIVNCADHGLPQRRQRLFIVGVRSSHLLEAMQWPKKNSFVAASYVFWCLIQLMRHLPGLAVRKPM